MMTSNQSTTPLEQNILEFQAVLQKYRVDVSEEKDTLQHHLDMLQWIGEFYDHIPEFAERNQIIRIINEVYQNGFLRDECEYHLALNNKKLFALSLCGAIDEAYKEYMGLVGRGTGYTNAATHSIMLSMLLEEHNSEPVIEPDHSINHTIQLLTFEKDNEIIANRIKEVYGIANTTNTVANNTEFHVSMMNWAVKLKDSETAHFVHATVHEHCIPKICVKIDKRYFSFLLSLPPLQRLASSSSEETDSSETDPSQGREVKVTHENILSFCELFTQISHDNEIDLLKEHFQEALNVCPPHHYQQLYTTTIQVAGSCHQIAFVWEVHELIKQTEFYNNSDILLAILMALYNNKHLLTEADLNKAKSVYKNLHEYPARPFLDKMMYFYMIAIWNYHENSGNAFEIYMDAMKLDKLYMEIDIHQEAMMGAAENDNKWILEAMKKEACEKLQHHSELLKKVQFIYQKARKIIFENSEEPAFHFPPVSPASSDSKAVPLTRSRSQMSQMSEASLSVIEEEEFDGSEEEEESDSLEEKEESENIYPRERYYLSSPLSPAVFARRNLNVTPVMTQSEKASAPPTIKCENVSGNDAPLSPAHLTR